MNAPETNHAVTRAAAQAAATPERSSKALPVGSTQHLMFVSLGRGRIDLERGGESISRELRLGSVAVIPRRCHETALSGPSADHIA